VAGDFSEKHDAHALATALEDGAALCTLIAVDGAFSRAVGAQVAVRADGSIAGNMTGGCLEAALVADVARARQTGENCVVHYGKGSQYIDIQLPCGGGVSLYVDATPDQSVIADALEKIERREAAALSFVCGPKSAWQLEPWTPSRKTGEGSHRFHLIYHPAPRLMLFGHGSEMPALASLAREWGCVVEAISPKGREIPGGTGLSLGRTPVDFEIDAWTAVILLFHEHEWEDAILKWALDSSAFYVGALGGRKAVERRLGGLSSAGVDEHALARLHGPIGLIPVAKDAPMLAISILAEVAERYGKLTGRLTS
jgi:xanthine dehydrogenase accessory factor